MSAVPGLPPLCASPLHLLSASSLGFGCHCLPSVQISVPVLKATSVGLGVSLPSCFHFLVGDMRIRPLLWLHGLVSRQRTRAWSSLSLALVRSWDQQWLWNLLPLLRLEVAWVCWASREHCTAQLSPAPGSSRRARVCAWEGGSCHCEELFRSGGFTHFLVCWWGSVLCFATPRMYFFNFCFW